jgi:hypothetical protein
MNVIVIASLVAVGTVILGALLAILFRGFNRAVVNEQESAEQKKRSYNPSLTYGYKIRLDADPETQLKEARKEAARRAVMMPRGANALIGRSNGGEVKGASQGLSNDPVSAVKIASIHSWEALRVGATPSPGQSVTHADAETAPPTKSAEDLVPGEDYEVIEITDEMSPAEKRKARIANVKAKAAAAKALKESGAPARAPTSQKTAAPAKAAAPAPAQAAPAKAPVAGEDYEVIDITDDMSPEEVRKARIANAKAKAAAMKAFKEAGGGQAAPEPAQAEVQAPEQPAAEESTATPAAVPSDIAPPDLIEITDDMDPEDVRKARIHNVKAKSAYKKALKEAGIDPSSVS